MKNFLGSLEGGSVKRQEKKKFTVTLIYATVALIVCLLAVLLITSIVAKVKENNLENESDGGDGGGSGNAGYTAITVEDSAIHSGTLLLVNKDTEYLFGDGSEDLVSFPTTNRIYNLKNSSLKVNPTALSSFNEMMKALYAAVPDSNIVVMTAYRSAEDQAALASSTPAGYSDFHTGMLLELKDGDAYQPIDDAALNGKYDWVYENAHKYGFVVRYPADIEATATGKNAGKTYSTITGVEDFNYAFRYVGVAHATYMYQNQLCLEEYLELIRTNHAYDGTHLTIKGADAKSYEVYYVASAGSSTEIMVPSKYTYEISGDNLNGYIITVCKSSKSMSN